MRTLPTWREKYGCAEKGCNRHKVFDRRYCALHDRSDAQDRRERWQHSHPDEQLPCEGCQHRRIFHHYIGYVSVTDSRYPHRRKVGELPCACSIPDCECAGYVT